MATENALPKPLRGAPLCKKHFQDHALSHIAKPKKPKIITELSEPTRIQPRRAAKDKHPLAETNKRKRNPQDELSVPTSKRRKPNDSAHTKWNAFIELLEKQVGEIAEQAEEKGPHNCSFGPVPWECHMCTSDFAEFVVEKLAIVRPQAPVANMATTGKVLRLNSRRNFEEGEMTTFEWEGLSYVIDACRAPMFMVL